jgi:hypothetical protein
MSNSLRRKIIALTMSSLMVVVLLGLGELYCRWFTRINFLDNSSGVFTYRRYGNTYGNTPNFTGVSFGEAFSTDADGFRTDGAAYPGSATAILIMGDSVAFGPAIKDDVAIRGNLRRAMPGTKIYNGAAIGYDTFDYKAAISGILTTRPEIKTVLLFFCLNDVNDASAQLIRSQSPQTGDPPVIESPSIARRVNDYLRSRSKLYLCLKNLLVDTQMVYFKNDLAQYQSGDDNLRKAMQPVVETSEELKANGVALKVFVMPYEVQLRPNAPADHLLPQRMLTSFLTANGIENYDLLPDFANSGIRPDLLFLYGDPMHVSAEGAKLIAKKVCTTLPDCHPQ